MVGMSAALATGFELAQVDASQPPDAGPVNGGWIALVLPLALLLSLLVFAMSGLSARCRSFVERITPRRWLHAMLYTIPLGLFVGLTTFPVLYWLQRVRDYNPGTLNIELQLPNGEVANRYSDWDWLADRAPEVGWLLVFAILLAPLAAWLIRRLPRFYWFVVAVGASLWAISAFWSYDNIVRGLGPLPEGELSAQVHRMAENAGVDPEQVFMGQQKWTSLTPGAWMRPSLEGPRVIIGDRFFNILAVEPKNYSPPWSRVSAAEVRGVVGHELAHAQLGHGWRMTLAMFCLIAVLSAAAVWAARRVIGRWGARFGLHGPGDVAAMPVHLIFFGIGFLIFLPIDTTIVRAFERRADARGLDISREPDGFAAFVARSQRSLPDRFTYWLLYDHPLPADRIRMAMEWKAKHPDADASKYVSNLVPIADRQYYSKHQSAFSKP